MPECQGEGDEVEEEEGHGKALPEGRSPHHPRGLGRREEGRRGGVSRGRVRRGGVRRGRVRREEWGGEE